MAVRAKELEAFLGRHRFRYLVTQAVNRLAGTVGIGASVFAAIAGLFLLFPWIGLPLAADVMLVVVPMVAVWQLLRHSVFCAPGRDDIARMLERRCGRSHQILLAAYELSIGRGAVGSTLLTEKVICDCVENLGAYSRIGLASLAPARIVWAVIGLVGVVLTAVPSGSILSYLDVPFSMMSTVEVDLVPGTVSVARESSVVLRGVPDRRDYPSARLHLSSFGTGGAAAQVLLRPDSLGVFSHVVGPLQRSMEYRLAVGGRLFGPETITVVPPPELYSLVVTLVPPRYTGKAPTRLREGQGAIAAYAGTRAEFAVAGAYPLAQALYVSMRGDTVPLTIDEGTAEGTVSLWNSGSYSFALVDSLGQRSDSLPWFFVDILPDYPPVARLVRPGVNRVLTAAQRETVWVEGVDDLGLRSMALMWRRSGETSDSTDGIDLFPRGERPTVLRREYVWDLRDLSLYPGDTVFYWAVVHDNRPFGDARFVCSDTLWFRLPDIREIYQEIAGEESYAEKTVDAVRGRHESLEERLENLVRSAKGRQELSWEEKKVVEDLGKAMQAQADSLQKAVEALQESVERMREEGILTAQLEERMEEVRKALEELVEEYGDSLLFERPNPKEPLGWDDVRESVEKLTEVLPNLEQRLEQALRYLETIKRDQMLAALAAKAERLAERQLQLTAAEGRERLRGQDGLMRDMQEFLQELGDTQPAPLLNDMRAVEEASRRLAALSREIDAGGVPNNASMSRMGASLQSLAEQLRAQLSSAMAEQYRRDGEGLLGMAGDALDLARWQEELAEGMRGAESEASTAVAQQSIRDALRKSMGRLDSLAATPPTLLQELVKNVDAALSSMDDVVLAMAQGAPSGQAMSLAAQRMNNLADALMMSADALQQCAGNCGTGGEGGAAGGMRKLSGKQAAVNALTSEILKQMLGGEEQGGASGSRGRGGDPQRGGDAADAARRAQQEIADQLKRLADEYGRGSSADAARIGELEEEARRLARMLENPTPEVREHQERFLVRMLQSSLATNRQDEGKEERRSTAGRTVYSTDVVAAGEIVKDADTFYNLRSRALDGNFPESYRPAVQAYFDSLGTLFLGGNAEKMR